MSKVIDVAAGVLINADKQVLLAQRPVGKHMAGYWEFPGGKFEAGESAQQALNRELEEELGIHTSSSEPLITLVHHYPERSVRLHVRVVREWLGELKGLDQQALSWVNPQQLSSANLLPADAPIVNAILLPDAYAISPHCDEQMPMPILDSYLESWQKQGIKLIQWRQTAFSSANSEPSRAAQLQATRVAEWATSAGVTALLNCVPPLLSGNCWGARLGFDGIHVKSSFLANERVTESLKARADAHGLKWVSAACHSMSDLRLAKQQACDLAVLGPVKSTLSHPSVSGMGWKNFSQEASEAGLPVYALGGCSRVDVKQAKEWGAQGIAAIREFWPV